MFITNSGSLTANRKFTKEEVEKIKSVLTKSEVYDNEISVEEEYGDIECDLTDLLKNLPGVIINGHVDYYGDYEGRYEVKDSVLSSLSKDEVAIRDASVDELVDEIERRGIDITRFCRYILITTVTRESSLTGFSSVEAAKGVMMEELYAKLKENGIKQEDKGVYSVGENVLSAHITLDHASYDWKIVDMLHSDSVR